MAILDMTTPGVNVGTVTRDKLNQAVQQALACLEMTTSQMDAREV